ncbi:MAG: aminotransferase class V-fold PLP-dependent enzyme [Vicinamibacterales bacterium]
MDFGHGMLAYWALDPAVTYLNHGTVGAVPKRVLAAAQAIREEIERQPSRLLLREVSGLVGGPRTEPTRMRVAAGAVARFIGARGSDVVFVDNATTGVNAVLRSIRVEPGDELLLTDHNYGATARVAAFVARERRAHVRTVMVPYPAFDPGRLVEDVARAIGPRTRVAVIDHITSESALIFPLEEIVRACRTRGVPVLVDGAHAPGVLPLDVPALGVDWYVANLHKWAHAPRSSGFLWADPGRQADLHPPVISWGLDQGFSAEFDWVGTRDPSPWLASPEGLRFLDDLGFDRARRYNHALAWHAATMLCDRWRTTPAADEPCIGAMATVALPDRLGADAQSAARLRDALLFDDRIEVQVHAGHGRLWTRISAQVYNELSDFERLGEAVERYATHRAW